MAIPEPESQNEARAEWFPQIPEIMMAGKTGERGTRRAKRGRPPKADISDPLVQAEICRRLAAGEEIRNICKSKNIPSSGTVYHQLAVDEEFRNAIARAREAQQESEVDKMIALADEATVDDWQVKRLQIWARQWRAAKLAPKKYGEAQKSDADKMLRTNEAVETARAIRDALKEIDQSVPSSPPSQS